MRSLLIRFFNEHHFNYSVLELYPKQFLSQSVHCSKRYNMLFFYQVLKIIVFLDIFIIKEDAGNVSINDYNNLE